MVIDPAAVSVDDIYKVVSSAIGIAMLGLLWRIATKIGAIFQWMHTTDTEVKNQGTMLQQMTSAIAEIKGWMAGKNSKNSGG